jgi:hypothetical protein
MPRAIIAVTYVGAMIAVIVTVDALIFRNHLWERLMVNIGIVLVFAAFYLRFFKPRRMTFVDIRGPLMRASSVRLFRVNELLSRFYVNYVLTIPRPIRGESGGRGLMREFRHQADLLSPSAPLSPEKTTMVCFQQTVSPVAVTDLAFELSTRNGHECRAGWSTPGSRCEVQKQQP